MSRSPHAGSFARRPLTTALMSSLKRLGADRKANISMAFALMLGPITSAGGAAIDYSMISAAREQLNRAADAAALGSIAASTRNRLAAASSGTYTSNTVPVASMQTEGTALFATLTAELASRITVNSSAVTVTKTLPNLNATVQYSAEIPSMFGSVLGYDKYTITGSASTAVTLINYVDFYLLLDISQSMGLAATPSDITKLSNLTGGCAFGCHLPQGTTVSNYDVARANNVMMRIDALRNSVTKLIDTATTSQLVSQQYRVALYTLHNKLGVLTELTADLPAAKTAAVGIDLGPVLPIGDGQTYFDTVMKSLALKVPNAGDGLSSTTPSKFVFIVTDGVGDVYDTSATWGHRTAAFPPSYCAALKARGIQVAVLYTTYLAMPTRTEYTTLVQPFASQIPTNLQSCASKGFYFEATHAGDIDAAMQAMFNKAAASVRLSS